MMQNSQKQYADRQQRDHIVAVGDQVLLDTRNLNLSHLLSKLRPRFCGPFHIEAQILTEVLALEVLILEELVLGVLELGLLELEVLELEVLEQEVLALEGLQQLDQQEQQHVQQEQQQWQSQQQPPLLQQLFPPVSGLRALGLPSSTPVCSQSPPAFGPTFPPPDASPAVYSPPWSPSPPPVVLYSRVCPCSPSSLVSL
ncbi:unnamed protein product [Closterium sp. NIES-53]